MYAASGMRRVALLFLALLFAACTRKLGVTVELLAPGAPFPFDAKSTLRLRALTPGRIVDVGGGRWDNGSLDFPQTVDPDVIRLIVEGFGEDGSMNASGVSAPLDLLHQPPAGPIKIFFTRIGEVSVTDQKGAPRMRARAISVDNERVLFVGGGAGVTAELFDGRTVSVVPIDQVSRSGEFFLVATPGGTTVIGGDRIDVLDPSLRDQSVTPPRPLPTGCAATSVSDSLVLIAGGDVAASATTAVLAFNPQTLAFEAPSALPHPRAEAAAADVSGARALFIGGRSAKSDAKGIADAVIFDPSQGAVSATVPLGLARIGGAAQRTDAGSVIVAGGRGADQEPVAAVQAIVVPTERAFQAGETSTIAALPAPARGGQLIDLRDGSLLFVPADATTPLSWINLLPPRVVSVARPQGIEGPLIGAAGLAGTAVLRAENGQYLWFNAGPSAAFGTFGVAELLSGGDARRPTTGLIPLRPNSWTFDAVKLSGQRESEFNPVLGDSELAVLGATAVGDFDATFVIDRRANEKQIFAFGLTRDGFDAVVFAGQSTFIQRSTDTRQICPSMTPDLAQPGQHRVHVQRVDDQVRIDIGGDGSFEIPTADQGRCTTTNPQSGLFAIGVFSNSASITELDVQVPASF
jgi:hypothetical protein